jgi:hypothetical protein
MADLDAGNIGDGVVGTGLALKRDAEIAGAWLGRGGGWSRVTPSWPSADSAAPKPDADTEHVSASRSERTWSQSRLVMARAS